MTFQIDLIQSSFKEVSTQGPAFVARFYEIVWDRYPELAKLFKEEDMSSQRTAFLSMFTYCIDSLHNLDTLKQVLHELGAQHSHHGIQNDHYAQFGECFLMTLSEYFYHNWTEELADQWTQVFAMIANFMKEGASSTQQNSQNTQEPITTIKESGTMHTTEENNSNNISSQHQETHDTISANTEQTTSVYEHSEQTKEQRISNNENQPTPTTEACPSTPSDENQATSPQENTPNPHTTISEPSNVEEQVPEIEKTEQQQSLLEEGKMETTSAPESTSNNTDLLDLIRQKAQEQAKKEVQALWDKAFEEAVHQELAELVSKDSAA
ncbi:MAG: globin domain-containing protein [Oligoflexales bacterium]